MAQRTDADLGVSAGTIKNETVPAANTATRIGQMFEDLNDSKLNHYTRKTQFAMYNAAGSAMMILLQTYFNEFGAITLSHLVNNNSAQLAPGMLQLMNQVDGESMFRFTSGEGATQKNTDLRPPAEWAEGGINVVRMPGVSGRLIAVLDAIPANAADPIGELNSMAFSDTKGYVKTATGWKEFALTPVV